MRRPIDVVVYDLKREQNLQIDKIIITSEWTLTRWRGGCSSSARSCTYGGTAGGGDFPSFCMFCGRPSRHFRYFIIFHLLDHGNRRRANRWLGSRWDRRCRGPRVMMMFPPRVIIFLRFDWNHRRLRLNAFSSLSMIASKIFLNYFRSLGWTHLSLNTGKNEMNDRRIDRIVRFS